MWKFTGHPTPFIKAVGRTLVECSCIDGVTTLHFEIGGIERELRKMMGEVGPFDPVTLRITKDGVEEVK
jgi:hypothetical protein